METGFRGMEGFAVLPRGSRSGSRRVGGVIMYAPANSSIKTSCQRCQEYFFPLFIKTLDVSGSVNP